MTKAHIKGRAARNWLAELLVDQHGEKARDKCCGPMLAAVEMELKRRQSMQKEPSHD